MAISLLRIGGFSTVGAGGGEGSVKSGEMVLKGTAILVVVIAALIIMKRNMFYFKHLSAELLAKCGEHVCVDLYMCK